MSRLFGALSEYGISLLELGLTWWLQSTILLLAGLAAAAWFRRRGPAIQSMIYRVTLVAVFACPLATYVLSVSGVSLLNIDLQSRLVATPVVDDPLPIEPVPAASAVGLDEPLSPLDESAVDLAAAPHVSHVELPDPDENYERPMRSEPLAAPRVEVDHAATPVMASPPDASVNIPWAMAVAIGAFVAWIVGALGYSVWLLVDVVRGEMLRRSSVDGNKLADQVCRQVASQLHVRSPQVLSSPFLNSPCLLGHWRPAVLLPEETPATTYHEVFLHELAHLRRGDWLWSLLGRAAGALLWCQPLLWILLRRTAIVAEEVCDDYVLQFGGDREQYLRQLVEIAERTVPRPACAGVAMVSFESKLGQRASRILDTTRVLSTSAGRWFACAALVATLMATGSVGTIYIGKPRASHAQDLAPSTIDSATEIDDSDQDESAASVTGRLVDAGGSPVTNAKAMVLLASRPLDAKRFVEFPETDVDGKGEFLIKGLPATGPFLLAVDCPDGRGIVKADIHLAPGRKFDAGDLDVTQAVDRRGFPRHDDEKSAEKDEDVIEIHGKVLDPSGRPVPDAAVYAVRWYWSPSVERKPLASVRSLADGSFQISFRKSQYNVDLGKAEQWKQTRFVAVKKGFGFGVLDLDDASDDNVLQLVSDVPLTGRVMDLEGNPVANAQVRAYRVDRAVIGSIDGFIQDVRDGAYVADAFRDELGFMFQLDSLPEFRGTKTDAEGRFRIDGIGAERVAYLQVAGDNLSAAELVAVSRDMEPVRRTLRDRQPGNPAGQLYGASIHFVVSPTRIVRGTVRNADTGEPIAGATVRVTKQPVIETQTDTKGRYKLAGMSRAEGVQLTVIGPTNEPYFNRRVTVPAQTEVGPIELHVGLHRGIWISGTVRDESGQGVVSRAYYVPFKDNPLTDRIKRFWQGEDDRLQRDSAADGSFRIVGLPGHGLLGVRAFGGEDYLQGVGAAGLEGVRGTDAFSQVYGLIGVDFVNEVREINHPLDSNITYDFRLQAKDGEGTAPERRGFLEPASPAEPQATARPKGISRREMTYSTSSESAANRRDATRDLVAYEGRVLTPEGKPAANVSVHISHNIVIGPNWEGSSHEVLADGRTSTDGRFHLTCAPGKVIQERGRRSHTRIVAMQTGYGPAIRQVDPEKGAAGLELRVVHDQPVSGRFVNAEGQPVAGITVKVAQLMGAADGAVDEWLRELDRQNKAGKSSGKDLFSSGKDLLGPFASSGGQLHYPSDGHDLRLGSRALPRDANTDAKGTVRLEGLGADRLAVLEISGPTIVKRAVMVFTRPGEPLEAQRLVDYPRIGYTYHPASFTVVVEPTAHVEGVVRDAKTGSPIGGMTVASASYDGESYAALGNIATTTDEQGRFRLVGLPVGSGNSISLVPRPSDPYFETKLRVPESTRPAAVKLEAKLTRGVWISGSVTEKGTNTPVAATLQYHAYASNEVAQHSSSFNTPYAGIFLNSRSRTRTSTTGEFTILGMPGLGAVMVGCDDQKYAKGKGIETLVEMTEANRKAFVDYVNNTRAVVQQVNAGPEGISDLPLEVSVGKEIEIDLVDESGSPVRGARAVGLTSNEPFFGEVHPTSRVTAIGFAEDESRALMFRNEERNIGRYVKAMYQPDPLQITLLPCGAIQGQIVDEEGDPITRMHLVASVRAGGNDRETELANVFTDDEGRFLYDGLPTGGVYRLVAYRTAPGFHVLFHNLNLEPGKSLDVGVIRLGNRGVISTAAEQDE